MDKLSSEQLGQLIGGIILALAAVTAVLRGHTRADGQAPKRRPMPTDDIKEKLELMDSASKRFRADNEDAFADLDEKLDKANRSLSRLEDASESHTKMLARVDAAMRYERAERDLLREVKKGDKEND